MFPQASLSYALSETSSRSHGQVGKPRSNPPNAAGFTLIDVLCGRGGRANTHSGNRIFRRLVDMNKECYHGLKTKRDKNVLVESIVLAIQKQGGHFLKKNPQTGLWDEEISFKQALLKTGQALRENNKARKSPSSNSFKGQTYDETMSTETRTTTEGDSCPRASPMPSATTNRSTRFHHVEECSDDDDNDDDSLFEIPPPPPMLRLWSSALHPATSKIAGPIESQMLFAHDDDEPCPPLPVYSFDQVLARQESWGVSGASVMPDLNHESSMVFTDLNLIED